MATDVAAVKCVACYRSGAGNEETAVLRDFDCGMTVGATEADLNISHTVLITSGTKAKKNHRVISVDR